jgi:hypothetical protein
VFCLLERRRLAPMLGLTVAGKGGEGTRHLYRGAVGKAEIRSDDALLVPGQLGAPGWDLQGQAGKRQEGFRNHGSRQHGRVEASRGETCCSPRNLNAGLCTCTRRACELSFVCALWSCYTSLAVQSYWCSYSELQSSLAARLFYSGLVCSDGRQESCTALTCHLPSLPLILSFPDSLSLLSLLSLSLLFSPSLFPPSLLSLFSLTSSRALSMPTTATIASRCARTSA